MKICVVQKSAAVADDAAAELASFRSSLRQDRIHSFTALIGTHIAVGFSLH